MYVADTPSPSNTSYYVCKTQLPVNRWFMAIEPPVMFRTETASDLPEPPRTGDWGLKPSLTLDIYEKQMFKEEVQSTI